MNRRTVLRHAAALGSAVWSGAGASLLNTFLHQPCGSAPPGDLLGLVPLQGDGRSTPFGAIVGGPDLDARRFTDLSLVDTDRLLTPTREVFLRTAPPSPLPTPWPLDVDRLNRRSRPMGAHLIECSGNTDPDNFGLMSVAEWDGVPLAEVLDERPEVKGEAVLVSGIDHLLSSRTSMAGASWIFSREAVQRTGAFLATRLNGEPLPIEHGAPVRLVVPGWYGCSWIKWVNEIRGFPADIAPTVQMAEFSLRTHQAAMPRLALDYAAPIIDLAATPIRVERRRLDGRLYYRVVGIVWGGDAPVDRLGIRFRAGETPTIFSLCPTPSTHRTWSLWDYPWQPTEPGLYSIGLTAADPSIRTRRLDVSFYVRRVVIDAV